MDAMLAVLQNQIQRIRRRLRKLEFRLQVGLVVVQSPMNRSEHFHELRVLHQPLQVPIYITDALHDAHRAIWNSRQNENSKNRGFLCE